eukprot:1190453-Prorocentrum_minimum.AAC.1
MPAVGRVHATRKPSLETLSKTVVRTKSLIRLLASPGLVLMGQLKPPAQVLRGGVPGGSEVRAG